MTKNIHSILAAAADDVEKSGVPEDLRAAAFAAAVAMRTGETPGMAGAQETGFGAADDHPEDWRTAIASSFAAAPDDIGEAFDLIDGHMHLTIPPSRLPRQRAAAMKDVALLVCAARQAAAVDADGWTAVAVVRDECRELGVLDGNNFASEIARLADVMSFRGSGRSRHLRVNRRGYEEAGNRLRDLLRRD